MGLTSDVSKPIVHKIWQFCMKFGYLLLRKIIKFVATRCQILRLKCTKSFVGWGSAPDPAGGAYSVPPYPLAGFKGSYQGCGLGLETYLRLVSRKIVNVSVSWDRRLGLVSAIYVSCPRPVFGQIVQATLTNRLLQTVLREMELLKLKPGQTPGLTSVSYTHLTMPTIYSV